MPQAKRATGAQTTLPAPVADGPRTLAIDVGGTGLKAGVLDPAGTLIGERVKVATPHPATPEAVLAALVSLTAPLGSVDRISVGFPGVIRRGTVLTAPNLGTKAWHGVALADELTHRMGKPVRVLNDGSVQGLGVIAGVGVECVITLGTGFGFAIFTDGLLGPHLEMSQHIARKDMTYDAYVGEAALEAVGGKRWNRRVARVIAAIDVLVNYDALLIGGGNAKHIRFDLPERVHVVDNTAGVTGGVRLWDPRMDGYFKVAASG